MNVKYMADRYIRSVGANSVRPNTALFSKFVLLFYMIKKPIYISEVASIEKY